MGVGMIILDGGLGRELEAMGAPFRQPEWSALALMEGPEYVRAAHDAFLQAGADIVTTNSYAIVPFHIGADVFKARASELLRLSGELARAAADDAGRQVRVAASVPPMFGSYQPEKFNPHVAADMMRLFRDELADYADLFLGETFGSVAEAELFLTEFQPIGRPVWLSVTLEDVEVKVGQSRLRSGEPLGDVLDLCRTRSPDALLFNCSQPEVMEDAIAAAYASATADNLSLIGVYANAFPLADDKYEGANATLHQLRQDITPDAYADYAERWVAAGARIIGGCCGISPLHIKCLKERIAS
jgi:S-methylmethionine-dependent homocysteine/selenocysteine methylase